MALEQQQGALMTPEGTKHSHSQCRVIGLFMLLLTIGLTVMSWVLLAYMSGGCGEVPCPMESKAIEKIVVERKGSVQTDDTPPLTIFVSVASYRDSECKTTMQEMFDKAENPHRVFVGAVQQLYNDVDEACWHPGLKWGSQIRSVTVPFSEARGPTHARHLAATLYRNEDYFFQIDSHSTFRQDWDRHAIEMLDRCPSEKCFLSHYPPAIGDPGYQIPVLCKSHFDDGAQMPSFEARNFNIDVGEFMDSPFVGAGFQLSSADVLIEVPFDPKLNMMFVGEEILYSARLWTNGWDMFAPDMNLVWHHYNREEHPSVFRDRTEEWYYPQLEANRRARWILGMNETMPPNETESSLKYYGMGTARNLSDYWKWAQIDVWDRVANSEQKFCNQKHVKKLYSPPGSANATEDLPPLPSASHQKLPPLRQKLLR